MSYHCNKCGYNREYTKQELEDEDRRLGIAMRHEKALCPNRT